MTQFLCPECDRKPLTTLGGWKRHMTVAHSGYTPDQLNETAGSSEGTHVAGADSFASAAAAMPETEDGFRVQPEIISPEEHEEREAEKARSKEAQATRKRMRARMDKLKEKIARDVPEQAFKFAGLELEPNDRDWIQESIETVFDILGVEFDIEQYSVTIRNRLVILLYPFLVICSIAGMKILQKTAKQAEEADAPKTSMLPWKKNAE